MIHHHTTFKDLALISCNVAPISDICTTEVFVLLIIGNKEVPMWDGPNLMGINRLIQKLITGGSTDELTNERI
jgi:hypothetical protein